MNLIKTPSFEAIDNIAILIFKSLSEKVELEVIKTSVSQILVKAGSKSFVSNYNYSILSKKYDYFTQNIKQ